jgi:hypothetical protein
MERLKMDQTKTSSNIIGYVNNIIEYFSAKGFAERKEKRKIEEETVNRERKLHNKRYEYIDSLQFSLGNVLREAYIGKVIISNSDKTDGYFIAIGNQSFDKKDNVKCVDPNLVITLNATSIDDMVLTVAGKHPEDLLLAIRIKSDDDYKQAKIELCKYIGRGEGAHILQDTRNTNN